jgi:hypothetical protein
LQFDAQQAEMRALKRDLAKALRDKDLVRAKLLEVLEGRERQQKEAAKVAKAAMEQDDALRAFIKGLE